MSKEDDYEMSADAGCFLKKIFSEKANASILNFSNGRFVRNVYEDMVMNHARRVVNEENPSLEELELFEVDDVPKV